jgi:asparagine synthase (glutamine-hydrolysing)
MTIDILFGKAFDTPERPYLPDSILWRQKEQFSDGVGYGWIDSLRDYAKMQVCEHGFEIRIHLFSFEEYHLKVESYFNHYFKYFFRHSICSDK